MITIQLVECRLKKAKTLKLPLANVTRLEESLVILRHLTNDLPVEQFIVLGLNNTLRVTFASIVAQGAVENCHLKPRDIFRALLIANSTAFIVGHNHPSGDPKPSVADYETLSELSKAGKAIGMPLLDSIIVTSTGPFWSAAESGRIPL